MNSKEIGKIGEDLACRYLRSRGVDILARNFRTRGGEIDIIGFHDETILFVEVKTRSSSRWGMPEEYIDEKKQKQIYKIAEVYLARNNIMETPVRFDSMSIWYDEKQNKWRARWTRNAF